MYRRRINHNQNDEQAYLLSYNTNVDGKCETDGLTDSQFLKPPTQFPWKPVILILGFMISGAICLGLAILISSGYFDAKYEDRAWPLLMLGILMFIPGGYYGYILICICLKRDGFTLDDVPLF